MTATVKQTLRERWSKARLERKARKLAEARKEGQQPLKSWRNVVTPLRPLAPPTGRTHKAIKRTDRPGWAKKRDRRREEGKR